LLKDYIQETYKQRWSGTVEQLEQDIFKKGFRSVCRRSIRAWDGGIHAFILDTTVHPEFRRRGIGIRLVKEAAKIAKERGIEWLHVDFEPHLQSFYEKGGFKNTKAGLINLMQETAK